MRKVWWLGIFFLLVSFVCGENLYLYDSLELNLEVDGELELVGEKTGARLESVEATLGMYPGNSFRQDLLDWKSEGSVTGGRVEFRWVDGELGKKTYGFEADVKTKNKKIGVNKKVGFPVSVGGYNNYLKATTSIDKNNLKIIAQAAELAEGEDDLFKVAFKLAKWVEENVEYELNSLTTGASQKASWVLEHKQGVCDEMTSLFIAMCRSLGIPAKFVSGVSYTTSELFSENWLPHGWAEVYFPEFGWVSFDIAFGEYGYVDVSHIRLREGFDPTEASTKFEWVANNVKLETKDLNFEVEVKGRGVRSEEGVSLEEEILGKEVELRSYNLVKGTVTNKEPYYAATTLDLAVPKEIEVIGEGKKIILLEPGEAKEVFWIVKISEGLSQGYFYEFPIMIYSEKNVSVEESFKAVRGGVFYSKEEIKELVVEDEEKTYSRKIGFDCDYEKEIDLGKESEVKCIVKNNGNVNLREVKFCLGNVCDVVDLLINQEEELAVVVKGEEVGWQKLVVSAESAEVEKKTALEYMVLDDPMVSLSVDEVGLVNYGADFAINLKVGQESFAVPQKLVVVLEGYSFENKWEMEELKSEQEFVMELNSKGLGRENEFKVKMEWENKKGEKFKAEKVILIKVEGKDWKENLWMFFNGLVNLIK